jgi:hypothetical protein
MSDEQTSYKVTDRRLFNPDGSPREVPDDEKPEPKPEVKASAEPAAESSLPETASAAASSPAEPVTAAAAATSPAAAAAPQQTDQQPSEVARPTGAEAGAADAEDADAELPGADDPASFASFLMSIASNAASSLGMMEHPVTGKREVDLELGKHWIDVLGMLQQKTRGNLLPQEQQIMEGLLSDLRMQYVSLTNAAPQARTYSSRDITGG